MIGKQLDATGSGSYGSSEWYALDLAADPNAPAMPVLEFDKNGNETYRYLNGPSPSGVDAVFGEEAITTQGSAGTTTYALADNLGSVRDIVNSSSTVVDHIVYNSFGQVAYESGTVHHWAAYAGYHLDGDTGRVENEDIHPLESVWSQAPLADFFCVASPRSAPKAPVK